MSYAMNSLCVRRFRRRSLPPLAIALASSLALIFPMPDRGAQQQNAQLYQGLIVTSVELVTSPTVNPEAYRPLVAQKTGASYSAAAVARTVAALEGTGHFTRVDVDVRPAKAGLRVWFILHPVFYVGSITFPGAKQFPYTRLLELVNYPEQAPYISSLAHRGSPALIHYFAAQGYFAAQVQVEPRLDAARRLVDIVYNVTLGPRAKFGAVTITGAPPAETAQLQDALHSFHALLHGTTIKPGKTFNPNHLTAATTALRNNLGQRNYLANKVSLAPPAYDPTSNRAAIHWDVTLGVTVRVTVTGAKVSRKTLKAQIPIYEENSFDQDLVTEGQRNLVSYFQTKGYFDAKITPQTTHSSTETSLVYQVALGPRRRVKDVDITGNQNVTNAHLSPQVMVEQARWYLFFSHGKFSNQLLNTSVDNLTAYYHNMGYQDVRVHPQVTENGNKLDVNFQITEGPLTTVASLNVEGNNTQPLAKLAPKGLKLKVGQAYSQAWLDNDRSQIIASYLNLGFPNATLKWSAQPLNGDKQRIAVTFYITEGPNVHIANVDYVGQVHTRLAFLQHNTTVRPEAPLSETQMLASESRLYNLGIFDWASVQPRDAVDDRPSDDVLVRVHEENRNAITYGFGGQYTPVGGSLSTGIVALPGLPTLGIPKNFKVLEKNIFSPLGSVEYTRLNMLGRAETASIGTYVSILDQRGSFNYTDPQFWGTRWSALLTLSAERSAQNPLFTARLGTGSVQFEKILNEARTSRFQLRYQFQRTSLTNLLIENFVPRQDQNVESSMVAGSFIHDTRDNALDAHRGMFDTVDLGISPRAFGSTDNFGRFFGQAAYYKRLVPWMVWANDVRLGLVASFAGSHVPISERFFSGGANSLRGFPLNEAGPLVPATLCSKVNDPATCTAVISAPTGGNQLFIINSEGRFPLNMIYKNLGGVLFYDGGNVYRTIGFKDFFHDYSNTIGIGLRYSTPVGPVRIDIGRNLNPEPGLKATNLFITLGQSF